MLALQERCFRCLHPEVDLVQTKMFNVLHLRDCSEPQRSVQSYKLYGCRSNKNYEFCRSLKYHGLCTWQGLVSEESRTKASKIMQPFVKKLISSYDHGEDEFSDIDQDMMNIVRMPRIGRGKHNIHFDPETSPQHAVLAELAQNAHFSDLLTQHMGTPCTLRESGISMTRPYNANITVKAAVPIEGKYAKKPSSAAEDDARVEEGNEEQDVAAGEGMEWHSDGPRGEFTILMALEDVSAEQGSLRVVPASHRVYVDGQGHTETFLKERAALLAAEQVEYNYLAGQPMIIDARTLHSVSPNVSDKWRVMVWFIFDAF